MTFTDMSFRAYKIYIRIDLLGGKLHVASEILDDQQLLF